MSRVTITDIALRAGVAKSAVSYALNGKPGVSEQTRQRVLAIADELGWAPSQAAVALSSSRADAIGLVLARPPRMLGIEPFYMEFVAGIESVIAPRGIALMLHVVQSADDELDTYRRWWAAGRVDGVLLVDLADPDPRIPALRELGLPAVCVSSSVASREELPSVWTDDGRAIAEAVRWLAGLGHERFAHVAGIPQLSHTRVRDVAFRSTLAELGLASGHSPHTDFSGEAGARATRELLALAEPPTAIIYDNDVMAVAGLGVAAELGVRVPAELSLLAFDDSQLCEITNPPLTALHRDVAELGAAAAQLLLEVIDGHGAVPADREGVLPVLFQRGSTGPARL